MPWLLYMHIFFSDFLCFEMSLLLLTVTLRGVSNKYCLFYFSFFKELLCLNKSIAIQLCLSSIDTLYFI